MKINGSEEEFFINFGTHIRQLREIRGLSQQELADYCGIPKRQIGRIERAEVNTTLRTIIKIASGLEIEAKELLDFSIK